MLYESSEELFLNVISLSCNCIVHNEFWSLQSGAIGLSSASQVQMGSRVLYFNAMGCADWDLWCSSSAIA